MAIRWGGKKMTQNGDSSGTKALEDRTIPMENSLIGRFWLEAMGCFGRKIKLTAEFCTGFL
jgi:hypothetical protein